MADKKPWELGWNDNAPQENVPVQQPQAQSQTSAQPWEMNWGQDTSTQPQQPEDDGSVWDTMKSGWSRMGRNTLAAFTTDKDASDYEMYKAKAASKQYQEDRSKLGTVSGFAADVGTYAPVVAAGIAAPELGAVAMGGMATADTFAQQQEAGQDYNAGNALATGLASGITDYATAGLAGRGVNVARSLTSPTKRIAAELGTQAAQAGTSNAAMTAYQNVALGRDTLENVPEAFAVGAGAGAAMHGANMGARGSMNGFRERFNRPANEDGQRSVTDGAALRTENPRITDDFAQNSAEHANEYGNQYNELMDMPYSERATSDDKINTMMKASLTNSGSDDAALAALGVAHREGAPLTIRGLNVNVGGRNLGTERFGYTPREMDAAGATAHADMMPIFGKEKAREAGYDNEQISSVLRKSFDSGYSKINEPMKSLSNQIDTRINEMKNPMYDGDTSSLSALYQAQAAIRPLVSSTSRYRSGNAEHILDNGAIEANSVNLMKALRDADMLHGLKNFDGTAFNPVKQVKSAYTFSDIFHAERPGIHDTNPDVSKAEAREKSKSSVVGDTALDALLVHSGLPPVKTMSRLARNAIRPLRNRRAYNKARGEMDELMESAQASHEQNIQSHLERGDTASAADSAGADLNSMGIHTEPAPQEAAAPEAVADIQAEANAVAPDVPVQAPVEAPVAPTDGVMARQPARERPVQEIDPEVVAQEQAARQSALSQDARVDSQRRAPVEEPVEAAPEPVQEPVSSPEGTSTTEAPEARTEAPVDYKEKVMLPVNTALKSQGKTTARETAAGKMTPTQYHAEKRFVDESTARIKAFAARPSTKLSEQDIYRAIDEHGGWDKMRETMKERKHSTVDQVLPSIVDDYKVKLAENARASAQRIAEGVEESNVKATAASRDEAIKKLRADLKSASSDVTDEMIDRAIRKAQDNVGEGEQYTARQVGNFVKQELAGMEPSKPTAAPKEKAAKPVKQTAEDSYNELRNYADDVFGGEVPPEIRKAINAATITRKRSSKGNALSDGSMKAAMNKMHDFIDDQLKNYEAALSKPDTAQPVQLANYRKKVAQLNKQRQNIKGANEAFERKRQLREESAKKAADKAAAKDKEAVQDTVDKVIESAEEAPAAKNVRADVKDAINAELKGKTEGEVTALSEAMMDAVPENMSSVNSTEFQAFDAAVDTVAGNLRRVGVRDEAKAIRITRDAIRDALKRKEEFPDNPELWLSKTPFYAVNEALHGPGSVNTDYGLQFEKARMAVYGSTKNFKEYLGDGGIKEQTAKLRKERKAEAVKGGGLFDVPDVK